MTTKFREPTIELPEWIHLNFIRDLLRTRQSAFDLEEAEALLEALLDICPNAKSLAHNWLLEEQKREYMKGGREP